ncbi:hypothetical protein BV898_19028 [Hypsibius exemplaris]|uniref:Uncharacterized protein n=1 Tax=Hypsibius exemplaris TaxID=2072580 RepID=A0A9X6NJZ2_HYPEX|nr:hypothetical protein BV898_19028 [Hypsibius exemplaris]
MDLPSESYLVFLFLLSVFGVECLDASTNRSEMVTIPCLNELNAVLNKCEQRTPSGRQLIQDPRQNNELLLTLLLFWHNNHRDDDRLSPEQLAATCRSYLGDTGGQTAGGNLGGLVGGGVLGFLGSQLLSPQRTPCQVCTSTPSITLTTACTSASTLAGFACNAQCIAGCTIANGCLATTQSCVVGGR